MFVQFQFITIKGKKIYLKRYLMPGTGSIYFAEKGFFRDVFFKKSSETVLFQKFPCPWFQIKQRKQIIFISKGLMVSFEQSKGLVRTDKVCTDAVSYIEIWNIRWNFKQNYPNSLLTTSKVSLWLALPFLIDSFS